MRKKRVNDIAMVAVAITAVLVMVFLFRMEGRLNSMKIMRNQLQSLRISANLFRVVEGRTPSNMEELVRGEYSFPGENGRRRFVDTSLVDPKGRIPDPFGNPYAIDGRSGWVRSTTPGYEFW